MVVDPRKRVIVNFTPIEPMQPMSVAFNGGSTGNNIDVKSKVFELKQPMVKPVNLNE